MRTRPILVILLIALLLFTTAAECTDPDDGSFSDAVRATPVPLTQPDSQYQLQELGEGIYLEPATGKIIITDPEGCAFCECASCSHNPR